METRPDYAPLHQFMREHNTAGTLFTPADLESVYEEQQEWYDGELPPYAEVRDAMLNSYYWQQAIADAMSSLAYDIMSDMVADVIAGRLR